MSVSVSASASAALPPGGGGASQAGVSAGGHAASSCSSFFSSSLSSSLMSALTSRDDPQRCHLTSVLMQLHSARLLIRSLKSSSPSSSSSSSSSHQHQEVLSQLADAQKSRADALETLQKCKEQLSFLEAELHASKQTTQQLDDERKALQQIVDEERQKSANLSAELDARLTERDDAVGKLSDLQRENDELVARFLELKAQQAAAMNEAVSAHDEALVAMRRAQNDKAAAAHALANPAAAALYARGRESPNADAVGGGIPTGRLVWKIKGHSAACMSLDFWARRGEKTTSSSSSSSTGRTKEGLAAMAQWPLLTCGEDGACAVWDVTASSAAAASPTSNATPVAMLRSASTSSGRTTSSVLDVSVSPSGMYALISLADGSCRVVDLGRGGVERHALTGHTGKVLAASFLGTSDTNPLAVSCGADRALKLWSLDRGHCVRSWLCASRAGCLAVADSLVATGHFDGCVRLWDSRSDACVGTIEGVSQDGPIVAADAVPLSSGDAAAAFLGKMGAVSLVDLRAMAIRREVGRVKPAPLCGPRAISINAVAVAVGGVDGTVSIFDLSTTSTKPIAFGKDAHGDSGILSVGFDGTSGALATADKSGVVAVWR
ncbi:autophagy-related protein 16 [Pseudoscourfieldia marina]